MADLTRRSVLAGAALGGLTAVAAPVTAAPLVSRTRPTLPSGISFGDVTTRSGVIWSRTDQPGRLVVRLSDGRRTQRLIGPATDARRDHTAKLFVGNLRPGTEYDVRVTFEGRDGHLGEVAQGSFTTADDCRERTSFVWTGDTAGQGWGINPDLGGMTGYRAMAATRPDFFIHSGDTVYADGPISETVVEPDGQVWRNLVTPEVSKVAETLEEFRGRHRYNHMDANLRAMYAHVPVIAQWDDHETTNNWYPGEVLTDDRYRLERRVDVLAARGRQAFFEYQPIPDLFTRRHSGRMSPANRIHRVVRRGAMLDVFCLDMRTFRDANSANLEPEGRAILGREQADWLIREVSRSRAQWKVIASDMPLGLVVPDGPEAQEAVANRDGGRPLGREQEIARVLAAFQRCGVKNVVWMTADVHYCAAHEYSPERASFTDFDPFWEFVAGPINAGTFGPNELDGTFGPRVDFHRAGARPNESPRAGNQFFGHCEIDADGTMTVSLRDLAGAVLYTKVLEPQR